MDSEENERVFWQGRRKEQVAYSLSVVQWCVLLSGLCLVASGLLYWFG